MNMQAILVLPLSLSPLLLVATDGSFRGQRTELPTGGAIGGGGPNITQTAKTLVIASKLADYSQWSKLTQSSSLVLPFPVAPDGSF